MDLQKFARTLPEQYRDWGAPSMEPIADRFLHLSEKLEAPADRALFPLLHLAVNCLDEGEVYCQIGCFRRGALVSALMDSDRFGYGVEAFFRYDPSGEKLDRLATDIEMFGLQDRALISDRDTEIFWEDLHELGIEEKIGVYYYDAAPDYRSFFFSLLLARDFWSDDTLIIINNCSHPDIQRGIQDFLKIDRRTRVVLDAGVARHGILGFKNICILARESTPGDIVLESPQKRVLNVGCGPYNPHALPALFQDGTWQEIRLDIDNAVQPDILGTITDLNAVANDSVDAVFSSHNLEHIYHHEVPIALAEFKRVLKPDGFVTIVVPDMQTAAQWVARGDMENDPLYHSPAGPVRALWMFYGMGTEIPGMPYMAHKTGFTAPSLTAKLKEAGFARLEVNRGEFEVVARAYK